MLMTTEKFIKKQWSFPNLPRPRGNQGSRKARVYKRAICAFDIETSSVVVGSRYDRIKGTDVPARQGFMYIWQFHIEGIGTIIGRTWPEFAKLLHYLEQYTNEREYFVVLTHNLSFEFQYLAGVYNFTDDEVFCIAPRRILRADMYGHFEFRCTYLHSNMSLAEYTKKWNVKHQKLSGEEFNYNITRYPWSALTYNELKYCINDVRGLVEAYRAEIDFDGDTLYKAPLTSTGYVRRDVKTSMRTYNRDSLRRQLPNYEVFIMLREAFRGGNTHCNRYFADTVLHGVKSADRSSSYPDTQCNNLFPVGRWAIEDAPTWERVCDLLNRRKKALLMRLRFSWIRLKDKTWGCPYIPYDKCRNLIRLDDERTESYIQKNTKKGVKTVRLKQWLDYDNGRILAAESLEITVTDVDLQIIMQEYEFEDVEVLKLAHSSYGKLPAQYTDVIKEYYKIKTELTDTNDPEKMLLRMKAKNKLNGIYGMSVQNPVKPMILFSDRERRTPEEKKIYTELESETDYVFDKTKTNEELLEKANKNAFSSYAWGVWVCCHARMALEMGIRLVHEQGHFVYCDTDSVKYVGNVDWTKLNHKFKMASKASGAYATDPSGVVHYMGVFEMETSENGYQEFKTLGAKKYCYRDEKGKLHLTCAGVNKKKGAEELEEHGGISAFTEGFTFVKGGGTEAVYNDHPDIHELKIDGHILPITRNVVIQNSTYTLGATDEYFRLLEFPELWLTIINNSDII